MAKFALGRLLSTPGALAVLEASGVLPLELLARHAQGDWGDLDDDDKRANDRALVEGSRILSAYVLATGRVWVITEAQDDDGHRAATTILLPSDY